MTCIIVDDEPLAIGILEDYVAGVPFLECVGTFSNVLDALAFLQQERADLLLLDVNMPELTGLQLLRSLRRVPRMILTTAYSEYALVGRQVTVVLNGKTIIADQPIPGITGGAPDSHEGAPGPIFSPGDHSPVAYRNLGITPAVAAKEGKGGGDASQA